jgi:hypothetical protein
MLAIYQGPNRVASNPVTWGSKTDPDLETSCSLQYRKIYKVQEIPVIPSVTFCQTPIMNFISKRAQVGIVMFQILVYFFI